MPEVEGLFNFPFGIDIPFAALQVHVVCHDNGKAFTMQNRRVPIFPTSVENPRILNQMIDAIDPVIGPKIEGPGMIHFDAPVSFVVSSSVFSCSRLWMDILQDVSVFTVEMLREEVDWKEVCTRWYPILSSTTGTLFTALIGLKNRSAFGLGDESIFFL
jgi:hypothetical protein